MEQRDFFISYTKEDKIQAEWVAKILQRHEYSVYMQSFDSPYGEGFIGWINQAIEASNNFVFVWSLAYSNSKWCQKELEAAYKLKVEGKIGQLIPARIEDYPIQGALYKSLSYVDLFNKEEPDATRDLLKAVGYDGTITVSEWGNESTECSDESDEEENHITWNSDDYPLFSNLSIPDYGFLVSALLYTISQILFHHYVYNYFSTILYFVSYIATPILGLNYLRRSLKDYLRKGFHISKYFIAILTFISLLFLIVIYDERSGFDFMPLLWLIMSFFGFLHSYFSINDGLGTIFFKRGFRFDSSSDSRRNHKKALRYYNLASKLGNSFALNNLGCIYTIGQGVNQDLSISLDYFGKSASKGNVLAYRNLGVLYEYGLGVEQNSQEAIDCYEEALTNGDTEAAIYIYRLSKKMNQS